MPIPAQDQIDTFIAYVRVNQLSTDEVIAFLDKYPSLVSAESSHGQTLLTAALDAANKDVFWLLVERGADIHHVDRLKRSPLACAARYDDFVDVVEWLLAQGVSPLTPPGGISALDASLQWSREPEMQQLLKEHVIKQTCQNGLKTPLPVNKVKFKEPKP